MPLKNKYQVLVIGGGHAGIEAASATARMGCATLMVTMSREAIGRLSCNPAIGGMAKGQLVCEIDALGGEMAGFADKSGIQFKMLGTSKGPAMWSPRSQNDKDLYPRFAQKRLAEIDGLDIMESSVEDVVVQDGRVTGVLLSDGVFVPCEAVVVCSGTFLSGRMHTGELQTVGGRIFEPSAESLSGALRRYGFTTGRLKTGTPPRIHRRSIDFSVCREDAGDASPVPFSRQTDSVSNQISCYVTVTTEQTHRVLRRGFDRSPMFTGRITGIGPRYCPSIEDKIHRFADKDSHQLFLEPEGLTTDSVYVNGFSTSLPDDVQTEAIRTIPGLAQAEIIRPGYAVEYDYFPSYQLNLTLESKFVQGLYFAGQVNGTSGYEEAAAQGLMAGMNAALKLRGEPPLILDRSQAYIGVLIDDLVNLTINEPYRMFTSRAEYRLLLRRDNADLRLSEIGRAAGLVSPDAINRVRTLRANVAQAREYLLAQYFSIPNEQAGSLVTGWQLLCRPEVSLANIMPQIAEDTPLFRLLRDKFVAEQIDIIAKYDGYITRQLSDVENFKKQENALIPESIDYVRIKSLSSEAREKLSAIRPRSIGQASRVGGITRSDLSILMLYVK